MLVAVTKQFDGGQGAWLFVIISATVFPLVAFAYSAPTFRVGEFFLNGAVASLSFPVIGPMLYASGGRPEVPVWIMVAVLMSGPALLSLSATALVWVTIRWRYFGGE